MKKRILISFVSVLVVIQFFRIDQVNPEVLVEKDLITIMQPNKEIAQTLQSACYNCHSNTTTYPWYANVAPVSWWVKHHVDEAREHLNFSKWGTYSEEEQKHKLEECYEELEEGEMPLKSYTWMHHEANLSGEQKEKLAHWVKNFGALDGHESDGD